MTKKFEEKLRYYRIPCKVYGGFKFYERKEVKDLLAYFRAIVNPRDNDAFLRIINTPKRGIGDSVLEELVAVASAEGKGISDLLFGDAEESGLSPRSAKKLRSFKQLYDKLLSESSQMGLGEYAQFVAEEAGFFLAFVGDKEEDISRRENLNQLIGEIKDYEKENSGASLEEYLQSVSLISDTDDIQTDDYLVLSTVHSVKGLEFDVVFVTGLEENVFPSQSYNKPASEIEEERRVMYVAMTRAKKRLYLTCARSRFMYGSTQYNPKSRFLKEAESAFLTGRIPPSGGNAVPRDGARRISAEPKRDLKEILRSINGAAADLSAVSSGAINYKLGEKVVHPRYGIGRIIQINGDNASVAFEGLGIKQFNMKVAPFKKA